MSTAVPEKKLSLNTVINWNDFCSSGRYVIRPFDTKRQVSALHPEVKMGKQLEGQLANTLLSVLTDRR